MSEKETDRELELRIENAVLKQERDLLQAKLNRLSPQSQDTNAEPFSSALWEATR